MSLRNIILALKDQLPLSRAWRNFVITRNAWGLFHINSHISQRSGQPKVGYTTKEKALKAAAAMERKRGLHFSAYKCARCDFFHLGKNRDNKDPT